MKLRKTNQIKMSLKTKNGKIEKLELLRRQSWN